MLISGTPRIASMKTVQIIFIIGRDERLPRAKITPSGKERVIAPIASSRVTNRPPHRFVGTTVNIPSMGVPYSSNRLMINENSQAINRIRGVILLHPPSRYPIAIIPRFASSATRIHSSIGGIGGSGFGQKASTTKNPA